MDQTADLYNKSVAAADYPQVMRDGVIRFMVPFWAISDQSRILLPPQPPAYWSPQRDAYLRASIHNEAFWAGAIGIAMTKMVGLAWEIKSSVPRRAARAQDILLQGDGRRVGWVGFLSKQLRDYLTTDNGSHFQIVRASKASGSRIIGLKHLDSLRCVRTGDPKYPLIFRDRMNRLHELRDYQVVSLSDMPDPGEMWFGVGMCAASRAYAAIYKLATIEWYLREKVGGLHPLAIHIVNGLLANQMDNAIKAAQEETVSKGVAAYMGAIIVPVPKENPPEVKTIPLAEFPDRFDRKQEFDIAVLTYANAIGLDPQELQPLSGQPLGTGAQSQVLDDKAKGKGLAAWRQDFTHALNEFVLDEKTTFAFTERDYRDQERKTAVQKARADVAKIRIDAGVTTPDQELQILVDADDLPKEFLPQDLTPGDSVSDTDKVEQEADAQEGAAAAENMGPRPAESGEDQEKPGDNSVDNSRDRTADKPDEDADEDEEKKPAAKKPASKEAAPSHYTSAMVALFLPESVARELALGEEDALPPSELHITLAYLGDTAAESIDREAVEEVVESIAAGARAIDGVINGQGLFIVDETEGTYAHFLTYDSPGLPALRQQLVESLKAAGIPPVENHGFTPHITLKYSDSPTPPKVELPVKDVKMPALVLAWGDERIQFPFQGETVKASEEALEEAQARLAKLFEEYDRLPRP